MSPRSKQAEAKVVQPKVLPPASKFASKAMVRRMSARGQSKPANESDLPENEKFKADPAQNSKPKKTFGATLELKLGTKNERAGTPRSSGRRPSM